MKANTAQFRILTDPEGCSLKRAAWAYGCSAKGSEVEARLLEILLGKAHEHEIQKAVDGIKITPDQSEPGRVVVEIPVPTHWNNTYSSRASTDPVCHPGDRCDNYPACESCGPARM